MSLQQYARRLTQIRILSDIGLACTHSLPTSRDEGLVWEHPYELHSNVQLQLSSQYRPHRAATGETSLRTNIALQRLKWTDPLVTTAIEANRGKGHEPNGLAPSHSVQ